jgi:glycosyltransferase involved in cell wall biosynthesis
MKIIYLHQYFLFPNQSGGTRSFDLATGFLRSGHDVEVLTSTSDPSYKSKNRWSKIEKNGLIVHYIYLKYKNDMKFLQRSIVFFQFFWFSTLKLLSINGDLVLATSTPLTIGIPALIKKWIHKIPFIFEARDIWPEAAIAIGAVKNKFLQKSLYFLEYLIYKNAIAIVPLSIEMKQSIISRYPKLSNKHIQVIENISEITRFQNGHNNSVSVLKKRIGFNPRFAVLYAGTFGRVNGIDYVIELADKLFQLDPTIIFILVGDGAEKKMIISKATDKGVLNKNVFIFDSVSKHDLPQLYFECDMGSSFVIPVKELWANSANKLFDTLAAGKPVLINYNGWQKELINEENIGYVLPIIINDNVVKEFVLYSQNKELIAKQKKNALKIAEERYAKDVAVTKYNMIFKKFFL